MGTNQTLDDHGGVAVRSYVDGQKEQTHGDMAFNAYHHEAYEDPSSAGSGMGQRRIGRRVWRACNQAKRSKSNTKGPMRRKIKEEGEQ